MIGSCQRARLPYVAVPTAILSTRMVPVRLALVAPVPQP